MRVNCNNVAPRACPSVVSEIMQTAKLADELIPSNHALCRLTLLLQLICALSGALLCHMDYCHVCVSGDDVFWFELVNAYLSPMSEDL